MITANYILYLLEDLLSDIHGKYYPNLDFNTFQEIVELDPTVKKKGKEFKSKGKLSQFLIQWYQGGEKDLLSQENIVKSVLSDYVNPPENLEYLKKYVNFPSIKNIEKYQSFKELKRDVETRNELINSFLEKSDKENPILYKDNEYKIRILNTQEGADIYSVGSKWCTTTYCSIGSRFKVYTDKGKLYLFYKTNNKVPFAQLSIADSGDTEFQDLQDEDLDIDQFIKNASDPLKNFMKEIGLEEFQGISFRGRKFKYEIEIIDEIPTVIFNDLDLSDLDMTSLIDFQEILPYPNYICKGYFVCSANELETLEGAPQTVTGSFDCSMNSLDTLEGVPQTVTGSFDCSRNSLETLEYAPQKVTGNFDCSMNSLETLEYAPQKVGGYFHCSSNQLKTLKYAPQTVTGSFDCNHNKLKTLEYAPQTVTRNFNCSRNSLETLEGAPQIVIGDFNCKEQTDSENEYTLHSLEFLPEMIVGEILVDKHLKDELEIILKKREKK